MVKDVAVKGVAEGILPFARDCIARNQTCPQTLIHVLHRIHGGRGEGAMVGLLYDHYNFTHIVFMQVFNEINSRKLGDSTLNVFTGITKSRAFMYVIAITVTLQIIIVSSPLATVFVTVRQNFWEWMFALAVGTGGLGVSVVTKLVTQRTQNGHEGSDARQQNGMPSLSCV